MRLAARGSSEAHRSAMFPRATVSRDRCCLDLSRWAPGSCPWILRLGPEAVLGVSEETDLRSELRSESQDNGKVKQSCGRLDRIFFDQRADEESDHDAQSRQADG